MRTKIAGAAIAFLATTGLVAGCGSTAKNALDTVTKTVCSAVDGLQTKLASAATVTPETKPEDLQAISDAGDKVVTALETVGDKVGKDITSEVTAAQEKFSSAVDEAKASGSVDAAKDKIESAGKELNASIDKVQTKLSCS